MCSRVECELIHREIVYFNKILDNKISFFTVSSHNFLRAITSGMLSDFKADHFRKIITSLKRICLKKGTVEK